MTTVAHLNALYSASPIILWVEDPLTRDYLMKVWGDSPNVSFLIAGNTKSIRPIVSLAQQEKISHVFGLVDRDFGTSNKPKWNTTQVFYLPRHEIENYMLDVEAIFHCSLHNRGRTLEEIQNEIDRLARLQPAWLACREVLNEIDQAMDNEFPAHPPLTKITSKTEAKDYILSSTWFTEIKSRTKEYSKKSKIVDLLKVALEARNRSLTDNTWIGHFSGKEIFRPLRSFVYQPPRTAGSFHDNDFASAIGSWQEQNNKVPNDLLDLFQALRNRVGLS